MELKNPVKPTAADVKFLYPFATIVFILISLFNTFILVGALAGLIIMIALTFKLFLGAQREKFPGALDKMASSVMKSNIWTMIIDYLTSPMNQLEKWALIFGWALWPIAAAVSLSLIIGTACESAQILEIIDPCKLLGIIK